MLDSSFTVTPEVEVRTAAWDLASAPPWGDAEPADQLVELAAAVADMVGGIHRAVLAFSSGGARTAVGTAAVSSRVHQIRDELEGGSRRHQLEVGVLADHPFEQAAEVLVVVAQRYAHVETLPTSCEKVS